MARFAFFSFHYQRDIWRSSIVRNSWVTRLGERGANKVHDASLWESTKAQGGTAIEHLIDDGLSGTSVTCVLVGAETAGRKWINYEITESHKAGKGLLAVRIHGLENQQGLTDLVGKNPFDDWQFERGGQTILFSQEYPTYDWVGDDGYNNLGAWVEEAAGRAGR